MIKTLARRLSFTTIIVICALLGTFLGTGVAYAGLVSHNLSVGTSTYTSVHNESLWSGEQYYYQAKQRVTMSGDKSDVTFETGSFSSPYYSTTYLYGDSNDPTNICYGPLWIWDEYGNNSIMYTNFLTWPIDNNSYYSGTYWFYGSMDATNNHVISEQYIWKYQYDGWTSLGSDYNAYITQGS
jgi:hypothetical protein